MTVLNFSWRSKLIAPTVCGLKQVKQGKDLLDTGENSHFGLLINFDFENCGVLPEAGVPSVAGLQMLDINDGMTVKWLVRVLFLLFLPAFGIYADPCGSILKWLSWIQIEIHIGNTDFRSKFRTVKRMFKKEKNWRFPVEKSISHFAGRPVGFHLSLEVLIGIGA